MRNTLLTTTALLMSVGVAHADVTFSGKAEVGVSRTAKVKAGTKVAGRLTTTSTNTLVTAATAKTTASTATEDVVQYVDGILTTTTGGGTQGTVVANAASASANAVSSVNYAVQDVSDKKAALVASEAALQTSAATATQQVIDGLIDAVADDKADLARAVAVLAGLKGVAASAAVKAGDNVVYTGYDMNVNVSGASDSGMTFAAAFDMGAGSIADRDDDRVLDAQGGAIALSTVTIGSNGITYVVGQNKNDDLYDDSQNGDLSIAGTMGSIGFTLVTDFDTDTTAVTKSTKYVIGSGTAGTAAYVNATYTETAAVAAVYESTSFKLTGDAGALTWSVKSTNKNDRGNAASKVSGTYAAGDALSFTLTHDSQGKREAINTLKAAYTMNALTVSLTAADDKDHVGNTNTSTKASQNMSIAYAAGPWTASLNNDESSQWWSTAKYDLGGGAEAFATLDHNEFAVLGMSFSF